MEREYLYQMQPPSYAGEASTAVEMAVNEAFLNGVYAGLAFHSLLNPDQTTPPPPPPPPMLFAEPSLNYDSGFSVHGFPATGNQKVKVPKTEQQLFDINGSVSGEVPQYDFFYNTTPYVAESDLMSPELPCLLSLELPQYNHFQLGAESSKNSVEPGPSYVDSGKRSYHQHRLGSHRSPGMVSQSSKAARQLRQKISEKTRCLQKLLPWDKKMDMATMLGETYNYIKFLQAQISVLQCMPTTASAAPAAEPPLPPLPPTAGNGGDVLGRLNRQQLLEVVVNSPVAQTVLHSNGCCVYSAEQLIMLQKKNNAGRNASLHNMI